jgi:phosphopantetheine adenylyltransferase
MNRVRLVPISDSFGPPGQPDQHFDALVLSHETLETGYKLNQYRVKDLGIKPLYLLCTRRTEAHGMSSTALRRLRRLKGKDTAAVNKSTV